MILPFQAVARRGIIPNRACIHDLRFVSVHHDLCDCLRTVVLEGRGPLYVRARLDRRCLPVLVRGQSLRSIRGLSEQLIESASSSEKPVLRELYSKLLRRHCLGPVL